MNALNKWLYAVAAVMTIASTVVVPHDAAAQTNTPRIDQREANQAKRIEQGVASGELNQREAARMRNGQNRVIKMEDRAKADGVVTAQERAKILKVQNQQSKRIYRQKHDAQVNR